MKLITEHLSACEMGINFYCIRCFNINHCKRLALKKIGYWAYLWYISVDVETIKYGGITIWIIREFTYHLWIQKYLFWFNI